MQHQEMVVVVQVEPCMAELAELDRHPLDKLAQVVVVELDTSVVVVARREAPAQTVDRAVQAVVVVDMSLELEPI